MKQKIFSWAALKKRVQQEKRKGRTIVFTNGCFDLIHSGHLRVLNRCKQNGDVLVLGLNSDASVRRLKGPKRPILPEKERAELLAGLEVVDYLTVFPQDTPEKLIRAIRPDVLVKGGDWKKGQIVGENLVRRVVRVPLVKGRSTTSIINLIARRYGK